MGEAQEPGGDRARGGAGPEPADAPAARPHACAHDPARGRPLVVGHRGAMGLAPENTLESFELAFELGADMLELDVHPTRDGRLVVIHDDVLGRTTPWAGPGAPPFVADLTLAELAALDAGTWFVRALDRLPPPPHGPTDDERRRWLDAGALARFSSGRVRPPALEDVLALVRRRDKLVNVELKLVPRRYPGLVEAVVTALRAAGAVERTVISSFDHQALALAKRLAPELPAAALCAERLAWPGRYVREHLGADGWNPGATGPYDTLGFGSVALARDGASALDAASVVEAHARGVAVYPWTVNDPEHLRLLVGLGVDGVITDYPHRLAALLAPAGPGPGVP